MIGIEVVDVNNDGKLDLVVTNHQDGKETPDGSIFVYEAPNKLSDKWTKHVLAKKFEVLQKGFKQAAPGLAVVFQPHSNSRTKPTIALAGDGSQKAYLLNAVSQSPSNWDYEMSVLHDCKATAGGIAVADVMGKHILQNDSAVSYSVSLTGTGSAQIFIPCYDTGLLVVYSY
jgi:hypothetical protein